MRVIGLDPGLRRTGWGVIEADGNRLNHVANGTIQVWINADNTTGEQYLFHKGGSDKMFVLVKDGEITFETNGDILTSPIQANQWYLVTIGFGSGGMNLYLDDSLVASVGKTDGMVNNNDDIYIGADSFAGKAFNGSMDELAIYDQQLSLSEISGIYDAGVNGMDLGTSDAAGDTLTDIENLIGSVYDDILAGDANENIIYGLDGADSNTQKVFHAGTGIEGEHVTTNGGRVLCVVGLGESVAAAARDAYAAVDKISWEDAYVRRDIGHRAIARENA